MPKATIKVIDSDDEPIEGASVALRRRGTLVTGFVGSEVYTDENGEADFEVWKNESYGVFVNGHPLDDQDISIGYEDETFEVYAGAAYPDVDGTIRVVDRSGRPVAGANVSLRSRGYFARDLDSARTDRDGEAEFRGIRSWQTVDVFVNGGSVGECGISGEDFDDEFQINTEQAAHEEGYDDDDDDS